MRLSGVVGRQWASLLYSPRSSRRCWTRQRTAVCRQPRFRHASLPCLSFVLLLGFCSGIQKKKASTTRKAITFTQSHQACATLVLARIPIVEDQCIDRRGHKGAVTLRTCGRRKCSMCEAVQNCSGRFPNQIARSSQREQEYGESTVTSFTLSTFVRYPSPKTGCRMSGLHTRPAAWVVLSANAVETRAIRTCSPRRSTKLFVEFDRQRHMLQLRPEGIKHGSRNTLRHDGGQTLPQEVALPRLHATSAKLCTRSEQNWGA